MDNEYLAYLFCFALMAYSIWQYDKLNTLKKNNKYYNESLLKLYPILGWVSLGAMLVLGAG
jgi:hypothetical protein